MRNWAVLLLSTVLVACSTAPIAPRPEGLFNDHLFGAPSERIDVADVFALGDDMQRYLEGEIAEQIRAKGDHQGFFDAVYVKGNLRLQYDSAMTRNAAQAFAARSGNCLSLAILAGAFAKKLGIPVRYQSANAEETWSRSGDIHFFIGHVNLAVGRKQLDSGFMRSAGDYMTIDFLPPEEIRGLTTRVIAENTIVAMYMNNKSAEAFAREQLDDAYWWAREAIRQDPAFLSTYNTLGLVYRHHGNPGEAERVLAYGLEREPANTRIMSNLSAVLGDLGRTAESKTLADKLHRMEPHPAFSYFDLGRKALGERDFATARDLFSKELDRAPYYDEFHYWLALAYLGLGDNERARKELALAIVNSTTANDRNLYAAKLDRIKSYGGQ